MRFRRTFENWYIWFHEDKSLSPLYYVDMNFIAPIVNCSPGEFELLINNYIYTQQRCVPLLSKNILVRRECFLLMRVDYAFEYLMRFQRRDLMIWMKDVLCATNPPSRSLLKKWSWSTESKEVSQIEAARDVLSDKDKVTYYNSFIKRGPLVNIRNTAKMLGLTQSAFVNFLFSQNLCYYDSHNKIFPYAPYVGNLFEIKEYHTSTHDGIQTLITPLGRSVFMDILIKQKRANKYPGLFGEQ